MLLLIKRKPAYTCTVYTAVQVGGERRCTKGFCGFTWKKKPLSRDKTVQLTAHRLSVIQRVHRSYFYDFNTSWQSLILPRIEYKSSCACFEMWRNSALNNAAKTMARVQSSVPKHARIFWKEFDYIYVKVLYKDRVKWDHTKGIVFVPSTCYFRYLLKIYIKHYIIMNFIGLTLFLNVQINKNLFGVIVLLVNILTKMIIYRWVALSDNHVFCGDLFSRFVQQYKTFSN